jgi:nucleoside-diphosphate-sugar epimerase
MAIPLNSQHEQTSMRICVIGATGVLGREVVPLLLQRGHRVRAVARSPEKARLLPQGIELRYCDLLAGETEGLLPSIVSECDAVLHIATAIPRDPAVPGAWDANTRLRVDLTRWLLAAALDAGVGAYVQQSIVMAYPDCGDAWIDEEMPLDSSPDRAAICAPVIQMEGMVRGVPPERLRWSVLRGGIFVGGGRFQVLIGARLLRRQEKVPSDGSNWVSMVHAADMALAAAAAAERAPAGSVFNIVDAPLRQGDYLDRLAAALGSPPPERDPAQPCPPSFRCSNRAAREGLGWRPAHRLIPGEKV